jgi:hypothetical protein
MAEMKTVAPWRFLLAGQELSFPLSAFGSPSKSRFPFRNFPGCGMEIFFRTGAENLKNWVENELFLIPLS